MTEKFVVVGKLGAAFGIQGWQKLHSFTDPVENIFGYGPWHVKIHGTWEELLPEDGRAHGTGLIVKFSQCQSPEETRQYVNLEIGVERSQLPPPSKGTYYWADLEGLEVYNEEKQLLGVVDHLFATGANDVMVVKGMNRVLIPYIEGRYIKNVDLKAKRILVDWDPNY